MEGDINAWGRLLEAELNDLRRALMELQEAVKDRNAFLELVVDLVPF